MSNYNSKFFSQVILDGLKNNLVDVPTYVYVADGTTDTVTVTAEDSSVSNQLDTTNQIIFGKKVVEADIYQMISRNDWTSGTIYSSYDDIDQDLGDKTFYVLTSARSVYKCINNNEGGASTIEPSSLDPVNVKLADGYTWRFMYRLTVQQLANLSTSDLIPLVEDTDVTANAVPGTIDYVYLDTSGNGYTATTAGYVREKVANTIFKIDNLASPINGIYNNSAFYIESGTSIGSVSPIIAYVSNSQGRYVTTRDPLPLIDINSGYTISPSVIFTGDGSDAKARTVVNPDGSLNSIEILNPGSGYTKATATIVANTAYGSGATARAVISPLKGHGSDVNSELFANNLLISVNISGDEFGTVPTDVTFAKFGLIRNMRDSSNTDVIWDSNTFNYTVSIETVQVNGLFERGDTIKNTLNTGVEATVLSANATNVIAVYNNSGRFNSLDNLTSQSGVTASVVSVAQPNVDIYQSDLLSITNINTITRNSESLETINVILNA